MDMTVKEVNAVLDQLQNLRECLVDTGAAYEKVVRDLKDCRNELCLRCGDYKQRHLGACDGCRWRADNG